uniref:Uncharacterized protein n=1 Tax=Tanacetum cinerariifolium TaxID=118510 RepID=A0A699X255_TANCI|nr:hypothetical protein [Tanacetum cinerariifolium]
MVTKDLTQDLGLYVPSAITIMKVLSYLCAITARGLAIQPRIAEADLLTTTITTTTATTIISRAMVVLSAELKGTLKETA